MSETGMSQQLTKLQYAPETRNKTTLIQGRSTSKSIFRLRAASISIALVTLMTKSLCWRWAPTTTLPSLLVRGSSWHGWSWLCVTATRLSFVSKFVFDGIVADFGKVEVTRNGTSVALTAHECPVSRGSMWWFVP